MILHYVLHKGQHNDWLSFFLHFHFIASYVCLIVRFVSSTALRFTPNGRRPHVPFASLISAKKKYT